MRRHAVLLCSGLALLSALAGCDLTQREERAVANTFTVALEDGTTRYSDALEDVGAAVTRTPLPGGGVQLDFRLSARSEAEGAERTGTVSGVLFLPDSSVARGRYEAEQATVTYEDRRDGTETRYAFADARLVLDFEVVADDRFAGAYRATATGSNGRSTVVVSGVFEADR